MKMEFVTQTDETTEHTPLRQAKPPASSQLPVVQKYGPPRCIERFDLEPPSTQSSTPPPPLPPPSPPPPQLTVVQKYGSPPPSRSQPLPQPAQPQLTVVQNYVYSRNVQLYNTKPPSRPTESFTRTPCFDYEIPAPPPPPPPPPPAAPAPPQPPVLEKYGYIQNVQHVNAEPSSRPVDLFTHAPCFDESEHLIDKSDDSTNKTKGFSATAGIQYSVYQLDDVDGAMFVRISQTIDDFQGLDPVDPSIQRTPTNILAHDEVTPVLAYTTGDERRINAYIPHEHNVTNSEDNDSLTESQDVLLDDASAYGYNAAVPGLSHKLTNEETSIQSAGRSGASLTGAGVKSGGNWSRLKSYDVVVIAVFSSILFVFDIATDLRLAALYHKEGKYPLFYITLTFIIVPSILMCIVDLSLIYRDRKSQSFHQDNRLWTVFRLVFGCLSFGRLIRAGSFIWHHVKSLGKGDNRERERHRQRSLEEKRDYHMLDFINAFAECAPQLLVQLYFMYKYRLDLWVFERVASLLSSWISIAWTYASYYKCQRKALSNKNDVTTLGFLCFLSSLLPALAGRFLCFALFITYFRPWIPVTLFVSHSVIMFIIIRRQKPSLIGTATSKWGRDLYSLLFAYVSLFSFVNLRDDSARVRMTVFYLFVYAENCIMAGLVFWQLGGAGYPSGDSLLHRHLCTIAVPACMVLHVGLVALYYSTCHPTSGRFNKHKRDVVCASSNVAVN